MTKTLWIFSLLVFPAAVAAQAVAPPPPAAPAEVTVAAAPLDDASIAAATRNARFNLDSDLQSQSIRPGLTVRQFLNQTASQARLSSLLTTLSPVAGPRWLDRQTCQVQIELPAANLRDLLLTIAAAPTSPITPDQLRLDLSKWNQQLFTAIGTGTARLDALRPPADLPVWAQADSAQVRSAIADATRDAVASVLQTIDAVPIPGPAQIGDALAQSSFHSALSDWIAHRPLYAATFGADRSVTISLSLSPDDLSAEIRQLLKAQPDPISKSAYASNAKWTAYRSALSARLFVDLADTAVGRAVLQSGNSQAARLRLLANQPPEWVEHQLDAAGNGTGPTRLLASRRAVDLAMDNLRLQVAALTLPQSDSKAPLTLGDAQQLDSALRARINPLIAQLAHLYTLDFHADGSVEARLSLDLHELWVELAH